MLVIGNLYDAQEFLEVESYTNVARWAQQIHDRPAVKRGRMVNRAWGAEAGQLLERHNASDFDKK
jgi:GST-like protein